MSNQETKYFKRHGRARKRNKDANPYIQTVQWGRKLKSKFETDGAGGWI